MIHNKVNFKMDARPERDQVELTDYLYDAGVPGGPVNNMFKIIIFSFFMWVSCNERYFCQGYLGENRIFICRIDIYCL